METWLVPSSIFLEMDMGKELTIYGKLINNIWEIN
jgi:hypothetical protein